VAAAASASSILSGAGVSVAGGSGENFRSKSGWLDFPPLNFMKIGDHVKVFRNGWIVCRLVEITPEMTIKVTVDDANDPWFGKIVECVARIKNESRRSSRN
jgi:hypothetical protein